MLFERAQANLERSSGEAHLIVESSVVRIRNLRLLGVRSLRGGQCPRHGQNVLQKLVLLSEAFGER